MHASYHRNKFLQARGVEDHQSVEGEGREIKSREVYSGIVIPLVLLIIGQMPSLDLFTVLVNMLVVCVVCSSVAMAGLLRCRNTYKGMVQWSSMFFLQGTGILLILLRGVIPAFWSVWIANGMVVGGVWLGLTGINLFLGKPPWRRREATLFFVFMLLNSYLTFVSSDVNLRSMNVAACLTVYFLWSAGSLYRVTPLEMRHVTRSSAFTYLALSVLFVLRFMLLLLTPYLSEAYLESGGVEPLFFLLLECAYVVMATSLVVMVNRRLGYDLHLQKEVELSRRREEHDARQRLLDEREKTISELKILSGMLPICSSCKKIRDDQGYWSQLEDYIHTHSQAEFSHSLCPLCAERFYPDLFPELKTQKA